MPSSSRTPNGRNLAAPADPTVSPSRIVGTGEMAELTRGFDWGKTVLGPVESWSDTLVTTVNLILASRHPMFLWWGPDLIQFYNDGYRPSIRGDKHPSAVGQRGIECWPEIWPIIGPQIEAVMRRGESTWNINQLVPINRDGKLEEVFWTYSYSPVRNKDGAVDGTLVVCSETTEQVLSERRLRSLMAITSEFLVLEQAPESLPMLSLMRAVVSKLDQDPADVPFAALFLLDQGEIRQAGNTTSAGVLATTDHWPLLEVANSQTPLLLDELPGSLGEVVREPWPEPVTRACLLPLSLSGLSMQAVLVFGISPRLPFDQRYETFLQLVGTRIGTLLQGEFHRMERARDEERFRRLVEANPFGTVIGDLSGGVKYVNPVFLAALGYSEEDVNSGKVRWDDLTPPEYKDEDARAVEQLRTSGRCDVYEKAFISKDGRRIPILIGASTLDSADGDPGVAAFVTDLTPLRAAEEALRRANDELEKKIADRTLALGAEILDRRRAEMSLRELTGRLLRSQDEERRHMARELHDHAGQTLIALGFNLSALNEATGDRSPEITRLVDESHQLSNDLSKEIRTLSYLLHPPLLDESGLEYALRWYVTGFAERSKIKVDLVLPEDFGRLPSELELVVFRVVQESLTNIHRHSGSPTARICLERSQHQVELEISDQGKGMSPEKLGEMTAARVGVGVRGMEERVRQFNGNLRIVSDSNGTKVIVVLPLAKDA